MFDALVHTVAMPVTTANTQQVCCSRVAVDARFLPDRPLLTEHYVRVTTGAQEQVEGYREY